MSEFDGSAEGLEVVLHPTSRSQPMSEPEEVAHGLQVAQRPTSSSQHMSEHEQVTDGLQVAPRPTSRAANGLYVALRSTSISQLTVLQEAVHGHFQDLSPSDYQQQLNQRPLSTKRCYTTTIATTSATSCPTPATSACPTRCQSRATAIFRNSSDTLASGSRIRPARSCRGLVTPSGYLQGVRC